MASPPPLDVPEPLASESLSYLDAIMNAPTRQAVVNALEVGVNYLRELYIRDATTGADTVRLAQLWAYAASEQLKNLPDPGAPKPVGLFGGQR